MARTPKKPPVDHNPKAEPGDNSLEEAERIQLISFVSRLTTAKGEVEKTKAPYDAAKKSLNQVFALARAADPELTRKYLEKRMEEMDDPARENPTKIARETRHRRWLGIIRPEDDQGRLQLAPAEVQDEAHWAGEGYKAGLRQMERKPPPECAERFVQPWLVRYDLGLQEVLAANVPGAQRLRDRAAAEFKADNPELDVDAAAKKLAADPTFMARGVGEIVDADPLGVGAEAQGQEQPGADVPFEATAEELAAQPGRRAIQERREANEEPVV